MPARVTSRCGSLWELRNSLRENTLILSRYNELVQVFAFGWDAHPEWDLSTQNHPRFLNILIYWMPPLTSVHIDGKGKGFDEY